jgi:hypothetical protein
MLRNTSMHSDEYQVTRPNSSPNEAAFNLLARLANWLKAGLIGLSVRTTPL